MVIGIIIIVLVLVLVIWFISLYNGLVRFRQH